MILINKITESKRDIILLILTILFFTVFWLVINDSYGISRDEMWYADYSVHWADNSTKDIRHITGKDIHQIAFLPLFRYIQRGCIFLFGKNIIGLRVLNLILSVILIITVSYLFRIFSIKKIWFFLFCVIILFDSYIALYSHSGRPDWIVGALSSISLLLVICFLLKQKLWLLFVAGVTASLTTGLYWNGIAIYIAFFIITLFLLFKKRVSVKNIIFVHILCVATIIIVFVIPILQHIQEVKEMLSPEYILQTSRISQGSSFLKWPIEFLILLYKAFWGFKIQLVLLFILVLSAISSIAIFFSKSVDELKRQTLLVIILYYFIILFVCAFRGASVRYVYHFMFFLYLLFFLSSILVYRNKTILNKLKLEKIALFAVVLVVLIQTAFGIFKVYKGFGKWREYNIISRELKTAIPKDNGRVLVVHDLAWALPEHKKMFLDVFNFKTPETYSDVDKVFKKYNIKYIIITARMRLRLEGLDERQEDYLWYKYLKEIISKKYVHEKDVYNKYYIHNKGIPPKSEKGFRNEIWQRIR